MIGLMICMIIVGSFLALIFEISSAPYMHWDDDTTDHGRASREDDGEDGSGMDEATDYELRSAKDGFSFI